MALHILDLYTKLWKETDTKRLHFRTSPLDGYVYTIQVCDMSQCDVTGTITSSPRPDRRAHVRSRTPKSLSAWWKRSAGDRRSNESCIFFSYFFVFLFFFFKSELFIFSSLKICNDHRESYSGFSAVFSHFHYLIIQVEFIHFHLFLFSRHRNHNSTSHLEMSEKFQILNPNQSHNGQFKNERWNR